MSSNKGEGNFHDEHNRVLIPVGFEVGSVVGSGDGLTVGLSIGFGDTGDSCDVGEI